MPNQSIILNATMEHVTFDLCPSAAGEGPPWHAAVPAADHLQPAESHRPVGGPRQTVQPGDHENHRQICSGEPSSPFTSKSINTATVKYSVMKLKSGIQNVQ